MILYNRTQVIVSFWIFKNRDERKSLPHNWAQSLAPGETVEVALETEDALEDGTTFPAYYQVVTDPIFDAESNDFDKSDAYCYLATDVAPGISFNACNSRSRMALAASSLARCSRVSAMRAVTTFVASSPVSTFSASAKL